MLRRWARVGVLAALASGGGACAARPQAKTEPVRPPLAVPEPPPRNIPPVEPEEPVETAIEQPVSPAPPKPARRIPPRPAAAKPDTAKEEPAKSEAVGRPEEPVESRVPPGEVAPALRTPQTANQAEVERKVRELLDRAGRTLKGVDYSALNADARSQYDTAKRFIEQANDAVKTGNFVFASYLADKADTLARGLVGR